MVENTKKLTESTGMLIAVGRTYRAKAPANTKGFVNDRTIMWMGRLPQERDVLVQYDSPSVTIGRHLPVVTIDEFKNWAGNDVTGELPAGEYQPWRSWKRGKELE